MEILQEPQTFDSKRHPTIKNDADGFSAVKTVPQEVEQPLCQLPVFQAVDGSFSAAQGDSEEER